MFSPSERNSDVADQAQSIEQFDNELAVLKARMPQTPKLKNTGTCHNCYTPGIDGVFCDKDCAEDYEKREKNKIGST